MKLTSFSMRKWSEIHHQRNSQNLVFQSYTSFVPVAPEVFEIWTCLLCALGADARVPKEQTPEVPS